MDEDIDVQSDETVRTISESSHSSATIIKYITPRVITPQLSTSSQGSLNSIIDSNYHPPSTTTHGLATLYPTRYSTIPSIHSINGERIIDELRELSRLTETLANTILDYCKLLAHNRAQELQLEYLNNHDHENRSIIEKMFQIEMERAQKLLADTLAKKSTLEMNLNAISQSATTYDEHYKQLLEKRIQFEREVFELERQIAQNNAESQFLKRRIHHFDEQMKFYLLKNHLLHERQVRLRHELDQELFSQQSLKMELEILENDKITNEDIHTSALDDLHQSIDHIQLDSIQPSNSFSQPLTQEIQRIREEYEKKIEIAREELHRKFELELYRYQIHKSYSLPTVTREHQLKLEQYQRKNNDVLQQIAAVRGSNNAISLQIQSIEKQIQTERIDQPSISQSEKQLESLNQLIQDRERQLEEILQIRTSLKDQIENYKKRLEYHSKERTNAKRTSLQEFNTRRSSSRLSLQEPAEKTYSVPTWTRTKQQTRHRSIVKIEDIPEEGTLTRFADFNLEQDCQELHRTFTDSNIDERNLARILCNRSIGQRLQIREKYKILFHQNLVDRLENLSDKNLSQLLYMLLSSPIELDCWELQRIFQTRSNDMNLLAEIIFTRSKKSLQSIREMYQTLFKKTLEQEILTEDNQPVQRIYFVLLQSNRPEEMNIDENEIFRDARELHETESTWNTEKSIFLRLLSTRSNSQLKSIFLSYRKCNGIDIDDALQTHTDGNLFYTLSNIVQILRNTSQYFANQLGNNLQVRQSSSNTTINIHNLNRVIVSRCEIDMIQIKSEYEKLFQRTLYDHIQSSTSGTYKQALLELIRHRTPSGVTLRYPFTRSSSERTVDRQRPDTSEIYSFNRSFDSRNQAKSSSLSTITIYPNQRTFAPMSTTMENHHDE